MTRPIMGVIDSPARLHPQIATIADFFGHEPDYIVHTSSDNPIYAAKWRLPAHRVHLRCTTDHILHYHATGTVSVSKAVNGKSLAGRASAGTVFFIPAQEHADWTVGEEIEVMQVYIAPAVVERFREENDHRGRRSTIAPIFGT